MKKRIYTGVFLLGIVLGLLTSVIIYRINVPPQRRSHPLTVYAADCILTPVFDISAKYWAWRVAQTKDVKLRHIRSSDPYRGSRSYYKKLRKAVKENIKNGNTGPLTTDEEKLLVAAIHKLSRVLILSQRQMYEMLDYNYCVNLKADIFASELTKPFYKSIIKHNRYGKVSLGDLKQVAEKYPGYYSDIYTGVEQKLAKGSFESPDSDLAGILEDCDNKFINPQEPNLPWERYVELVEPAPIYTGQD